MNDTASNNMNAAYKIGNEVACTDEQCGSLVRVIVNPVARTITHLVVEPNHSPDSARLVPVGLVDADSVAIADTIRLTCDHAGFEALERAQTEDYLPGEQDALGYQADQTLRLPYFPYGGAVFPAPGPGNIGGEMVPPAAAEPRVVTYDRVPLGDVQIRRHQSVHAADGDIGRVQGLVVDPRDEHVTHILLQEGHLWGKKLVAIPISAVTDVKDGIHLKLSKSDVHDLPEIELGH
jgi:sporulation protein YlmC with PRC-barrel domain